MSSRVRRVFSIAPYEAIYLALFVVYLTPPGSSGKKEELQNLKKKFIFRDDPFIFPNLDVVKTCKVKAGASISLVNFLDDNFLPLVFSNEGTPKKTRKRKKEESIETSLHKDNFQTCKRNSVLRFSG